MGRKKTTYPDHDFVRERKDNKRLCMSCYHRYTDVDTGRRLCSCGLSTYYGKEIEAWYTCDEWEEERL